MRSTIDSPTNHSGARALVPESFHYAATSGLVRAVIAIHVRPLQSWWRSCATPRLLPLRYFLHCKTRFNSLRRPLSDVSQSRIIDSILALNPTRYSRRAQYIPVLYKRGMVNGNAGVRTQKLSSPKSPTNYTPSS